jgi:membrane protein YqaA with SNARE-associated domain
LDEAPGHHTGNGSGSSGNLPVLASEVRPEPARSEVRTLERASEVLPAPVVAAAGGFLGGVATFMLVRVLRGRGQRTLMRRVKRRDKALQIAGSRSFLVDVHVLKR